MNRIGIIGLDTSHPEAFADIVEGMSGLTIGGVWDTNDIRSQEYVESFCAEHGATHYDSVAALLDAVDAAMVLTVDWESHVPLGEAALEAGLPTVIDKPITGSVDGIHRLERAARDGQLFGGSAVPFHDALASGGDSGDDRTLYAAGYNDCFYYRVHLTDTVRYLTGADWTRVSPGDGPGTTVDVQFKNGDHATLRFDGSTADATFGLLDVGETTSAVEIESDESSLSSMYRPFLRAFRSMIVGERDHTGRLLDSARLLLAVEKALNGNATVTAESDLTTVTVGSEEFLRDYEPYY